MYPVTETSSTTLNLSGSIKTSTVRHPATSGAPQTGQSIRPYAHPSTTSRATQPRPLDEIYRRQSPIVKSADIPHSAPRVQGIPQSAARVSGRPISPSAAGMPQRSGTMAPNLKQVPTAYQASFTQRPIMQTPVSAMHTPGRPVETVQPLVRKTSSSHTRITASVKMSRSGAPSTPGTFTQYPSRMATGTRTIPRYQNSMSPVSFDLPISSEQRFIPEQLQLDQPNTRAVLEERQQANLQNLQGDQLMKDARWNQELPSQSWEDSRPYYDREDVMQEMKKLRATEKESDFSSEYYSESGDTEKLPEFWELYNLSPIKAFDEAVMEEIDRRQVETYILDTAMTPRVIPSRDKDGRSHMAVHSSLSAIDIERSLRFIRDTELMEVIDKFIQAEQACHFDGAIKAAEAAAAAAPPELAEEAAAEGARNYQAHIMDTIQEKLPGFRPLELVGYVGVTKVHAKPEDEQQQEKSSDISAHQ